MAFRKKTTVSILTDCILTAGSFDVDATAVLVAAEHHGWTPEQAIEKMVYRVLLRDAGLATHFISLLQPKPVRPPGVVIYFRKEASF